ncbi:MAG: SLBB domain-containing protein [Verrucomicrobiales bacterium]
MAAWRPSGFAVTVTGEVNPPAFRSSVGTRLLDVIHAAAGGFTDFADTAAVKLIRDGKATTYPGMKSVNRTLQPIQRDSRMTVYYPREEDPIPRFGGDN